MKPYNRFKQKTFQAASLQRGSTLIEILVSMFILALGIMALLSMQVRTAAGIKEAENMSIIAQATQNLAEGMAINPTLNYTAATGGVPSKTTKNYSAYGGECPASAAVSAASGVIERSDLVTNQRNQFCATIQAIPGVQSIKAEMSAASGIIVTWTMATDGTASGVTYTYTQVLDQ
ncbi:MAG: type IV pilus modification protein PilV [Neisseria sp.]|nr:type IV pilus modification protein PilV [Neisseria sp.]